MDIAVMLRARVSVVTETAAARAMDLVADAMPTMEAAPVAGGPSGLWVAISFNLPPLTVTL